jgi:uncharacterized protein YbjT (DUF2867 family)
MSRNPQKARDQFGDTVEVVAGDVFDPSALGDAMQNCSGVHVSIMTDNEYQAVSNVIKAAKQHSVQQLSYVSGATVCEQNRWFAQIDQKFRAEHIVRESGIDHTIFCPTWFMEMLPRFAQSGRAVVLGNQPTPYHWIAVEDFARMVSQGYAVNETVNRRFTIWGPEATPMREALQCYCAALRPEIGQVTTMPIWLARAMAFVNRNDGLRFAANLMAYFEKVPEGGDPAEANRILGAPQTSLDDWLRQRMAERTSFAN